MGMGREWREALAAIWAAIHREADARVAPFTRGGKLDLSTPNQVGRVPASGGGTGHDAGAEPPLGNPAAPGDVLTSTTGGARRWVPLLAGPGIAIDVNPTTGAITISATDNIETLTFGGDDLTFGGDTLQWGMA